MKAQISLEPTEEQLRFLKKVMGSQPQSRNVQKRGVGEKRPLARAIREITGHRAAPVMNTRRLTEEIEACNT